MTTVTRTIAGRKVSASCDPSRIRLAEDALTTLERIAARDPLRGGLRVRFGWSMLTLREEPDGGLTACEPDFAGDPLRDVRPSLDTTLDVAAGQVAFTRLVGITAADTWFDQYVIVARGALTAPRVQLVRRAPTAVDDSGWSLAIEGADSPDDPDALEGLRSYRLLALRPAALPVLVAPAGFTVILDGDQLVSVLDPQGGERLRGHIGPA